MPNNDDSLDNMSIDEINKLFIDVVDIDDPYMIAGTNSNLPSKSVQYTCACGR